MISPIVHDEAMKNDIDYVKSLAKFALEHRDEMIKILIERLLFITACPDESRPRVYESVFLEAMGDPDICGNPYLMSAKDFNA